MTIFRRVRLKPYTNAEYVQLSHEHKSKSCLRPPFELSMPVNIWEPEKKVEKPDTNTRGIFLGQKGSDKHKKSQNVHIGFHINVNS